MTAIITLPSWMTAKRKTYITRSGGKYTPDDVALRFALALRIYDSAESIRVTARNLVDKVCLEHQPNMKRLAREPSDRKVFDAAIKIVTRVCEMLGMGSDEFERNEYDKRYIMFTGEQLNQMAEYYLGGASLDDVSKRYGISPSVVSRRLKGMGFAVRPGGKRQLITDQVMDQALALRALDVAWKQIGLTLGFNWESLQSAIRARRLAAGSCHG